MTMHLKILLFGITKDIFGGQTHQVELDQGATVKMLKEHLIKERPEVEGLTSLLIAVNNTYAKEDDLLSEQDEIALIPPVSGG